MRIGPNWLLTVRGRVSGELRTQPLAVIEVGGSKYVIGTFGEVNWCRNLRANPEAEIRRGSRHELVRAVELTPDQAATFFREVLVPSLPHMPILSRIASKVFISSVAPDIYSDPDGAALRRPVFELRPREA
jgi:deazaflavin-dependent oxidoreductase (nitroreductase family)